MLGESYVVFWCSFWYVKYTFLVLSWPRSWRLHLSGGPGNDLAHWKAAKEALCYRLTGVRAQHRPRLHQTGQWHNTALWFFVFCFSPGVYCYWIVLCSWEVHFLTWCDGNLGIIPHVSVIKTFCWLIKWISTCPPLSHLVEVPRTRHLQSPPPDVAEGGAPAPHAKKSSLPN